MLHELIKENCEEYHVLSEDEKGRLVEEFNEFKVSKAVGIRTTAKSKINDVTYTLKAVENKVSFLFSHCLRYLSPELFFSSSISGLVLASKLFYLHCAEQPIFHFKGLPLQLTALLTSWAQLWALIHTVSSVKWKDSPSRE